MFDKEFLEQDRKAREDWQRRYDKAYKGKTFEAATSSGIPVKPVYGPSDIEHLDFQEIGMPGEYPYTRGIYPLHYQFQPWMNQLVHGYGLPEQTRERMDLLSKEGMKGYFGIPSYNLVFDLVSKAGNDPDHPEAAGLVGQGGLTLCTLDDMERLFGGMPLDKTRIVHNIGSATLVELAMFIVYAERQGVAPNQLLGNSMNWLYKAPFVDYAMFPPSGAFSLMTELIKYCSRNMPQWNTTNLCGYFVEEAGGNCIQEAAFILAAGIAISEACLGAGLQADEFLPRLGFQFAQGNDFFEHIAKLRAIRKMWAKITRERLGARDPKSMHLRVHIHTSGTALTAQQPLNNLIRATLHTLGSVLAGTNSIATAAYDEAFAIPTEEAATLALRTQQIILEETHIPNVSDPLAGSYYLEWLTHKLEEEAFRLIAQIDERGGYQRCWESGWFKDEIARSAYQWREKVDRGEQVVVGLNKHQAGETHQTPLFRVDPEVERTAAERVKAYRARRDHARTQAALDRFKAVARQVKEGKGTDLMPAAIEAARAEATLGEMQGVLKEVFGWGYTP